jgi:cutinase
LLTRNTCSQGAAVLHNAVPLVSAGVKKQLVAGALFGDTRNDQSNASIQGFPKEDLLVVCTKDDGVCWRKTPTNGHLVYTQNGDVDRAANFLSQKIDAALKKG